MLKKTALFLFDGFPYLGVILFSLLCLSQLQVLLRNDADIVAVRRGCMFTGWTGVSYDGEKIVVDAWQEDYWVVFARWHFLSDFSNLCV